MEEGDFNLSNLNVVANQIASEIEEEQTKVSQTEAPQQQIEDARFSWTDDSIEVKNIGMHESRGEIADDSINYSADDEDQNYDPLLDEKLKATCFVKPTLNEHPSQAESSSTPYQEVELDENYCNGYVSSMRLVINPDSGSSDDEETSNQKNVDNNGSETTPVKVPDDNKPENNDQDNKTENANGEPEPEAKNETAAFDDLGSESKTKTECQEVSNAPCEQNVQSNTIQVPQTQTTCTGQYLESGTTCYVYQQVPQNFASDASGNLVYYQVPCQGLQCINGNYYYLPPEYSYVVTENQSNEQIKPGESTVSTQIATENGKDDKVPEEENKTPVSRSPSDGNENDKTVPVEGNRKHLSSAAESTEIPRIEEGSVETHYQYLPCGEHDAETMPFNPYQTLQQPLFAADIYHPYMEPVRLNTNFQYPAVYVSQYGLITVLLKHDVSVEMTADRAIRLVSHQKNLVVASSATGDSNFIVHPAGKISHTASTVEADIYLNRRVKMTDEQIVFGNANQTFKFNTEKVEVEEKPDFTRLSKNSSVSILFSSNNVPDQNLVMNCLDLIASAHYEPLHQIAGGYMVKINNIKVIQTNKGDVKVICADKYMRLSPREEDLHIRSKYFIEMGIESDWSVWINHGKNFLRANRLGFILCNSSIEAGFDAHDYVRACRVPSGIPIHVEGSYFSKRRYVPRTRKKSTKELD